jgi:hypothetical protein
MVFIDQEKAYDKVPRMSFGGVCRSTKSQQSTLPLLMICTIML